MAAKPSDGFRYTPEECIDLGIPIPEKSKKLNGFYMNGGPENILISFAGKYAVMGVGWTICISVVDKKTGKVVGYDLRACTMVYESVDRMDPSITSLGALLFADGPIVSQIENSCPDGEVGQGYPDPDWEPGTLCLLDHNRKLYYESAFNPFKTPCVVLCSPSQPGANHTLAFGIASEY